MVALGIVVFAGVGVYLLFSAHAGTPTAQLQPEDGVLTSRASAVADSTASGGKGVKFTAPTASFSGPPYYFGSLVTPRDKAATEAATMKLAMVEIKWNLAQPNGPTDWNDDYLDKVRTLIQTFRDAGREVVVGFGYHFTPQWVLDLSSMKNQAGVERTDEANMVFSQAVRTATNNYIQHVDAKVGLENAWGVRINVTGAQGEIQYPDSNYWAFSTGAQNGADKPTNLAANPFPGWKPATGNVSLTTTQVDQWARWYQGALANALDEQIDTIRSTGFKGYYFMVSAGGGERPSAWVNDVNNKLQSTSLIGRGVAWDKLYSMLKNRKNIVAYSSSTAETSNYNTCTAADKSVALSSTTANTWSAARWLSRVADENGFYKGGENPGYSDSGKAYYTDTSTSGMMSRAVELTTTCNYLAFFWAHDAQLWDSTLPGTSFSRYSQLINQVNNNANPKPTFPQ